MYLEQLVMQSACLLVWLLSSSKQQRQRNLEVNYIFLKNQGGIRYFFGQDGFIQTQVALNLGCRLQVSLLM